MELGSRVLGLQCGSPSEDSQFSLVVALPNRLQSLLARTKLQERGPRPGLFGQRSFCPEKPWDTDPIYEESMNTAEHLKEILLKPDVRLHQHRQLVTLAGVGQLELECRPGGSVAVRELQTGRVTTHQLHSARLTAALPAGPGRLLTAGLDGKVRAWQVGEQWRQTGEWTGPGSGLAAMALHNDQLVVADTTGNIFCLNIMS